MLSRRVLALALTLCLPAGLSAGEEAKQEPGEQEKDPAEEEFRSKLEALRKLLDEPGSVRVVQPLLEPPPGPWKAVQGVAKAGDGSAPDIPFAEDLERMAFNDRTPVPFSPANLKIAFEEASARGGIPVPEPVRPGRLWFLEMMAGGSRMLLVSNGTDQSAYSLGREGPTLAWARRIVYDSELVEFYDRTPIQFRVCTLAMRWREDRQARAAPEKPPAFDELKVFSIATCSLDGPRRVIFTVAKGTLCGYVLWSDSGQFYTARRTVYEFAMPTFPPGMVATMEETVSCVLKGKDDVAAKDRWIALVVKGDTVYAILCVKGTHCIYEVKVPVKPASPDEKGIAFMGAWRRE